MIWRVIKFYLIPPRRGLHIVGRCMRAYTTSIIVRAEDLDIFEISSKVNLDKMLNKFEVFEKEFMNFRICDIIKSYKSSSW